MGRNDNPKLPTLDPWVLRDQAAGAALRLHRATPITTGSIRPGISCPISTRSIVDVADSKLIPTKTGAGETDLQARYIRFDNYTFLKQAEKRGPFGCGSGKTAAVQQLGALSQPQLPMTRPGARSCATCASAARCSLGIDRHEINQAIYFGLGKEGANTIQSLARSSSRTIADRLVQLRCRRPPTGCWTRWA